MKRILFAASLLVLSLASCATFDERFKAAVNKREWEEAKRLAESAEEKKRGDYLYEYASRNFTLSLEQRIELLAKAGTETARRDLAGFARDASRSGKFERAEQLYKMAGASAREIDQAIGDSAFGLAQGELRQLYSGADQVPPELRARFESYKTLAFDRLSRLEKKADYLAAVASLLGGDRRFAEAKPILEGAYSDKAALAVSLSSMYAWGASYTIDHAEKRYDAVQKYIDDQKRNAKFQKKPEPDTSKDQTAAFDILRQGLAEANSYALESFAQAIASGNSSRVEYSADAVIRASLNTRLNSAADIASARKIFDYYRGTGAASRMVSIARSAASAGVYEQAAEWFEAAGKPKAEYFLTIAEIAEKRKEPAAVTAGFVIRSGDRKKMASDADFYSSRAKALWDRQYTQSGATKEESRTTAVAYADAAILYGAALKDEKVLERCVEAVYYSPDSEKRLSGYYRAFGYDDAKIVGTLALLHERKSVYDKAIDAYEKAGDRAGMERSADKILKGHLEKYRLDYRTITLNTALWKVAFEQGTRTDVFKKKIEECMTDIRIFRSSWQKDLGKAASTYRTLGKIPKAFEALEALAEVGGIDEARTLRSKWFAEDRALLDRLEKAAAALSPENVLKSGGYVEK